MHHTERSGLAWALAGFVLLSTGDAVIKSIAGAWAPTAIAATRYVLGAAGLGLLLAWREGREGFAMPSPALQALRGFGVAIATLGFFSAVFLMPLAEATAITFTSPMITALLSALFLGEPARRETWLASVLAFVGMLIVLRPNLAELGLAALLPLLSAIGMSLLMIGNRAVAGKASALASQFFVAIMAAPLLVVATFLGTFTSEPRLAVAVPDWTILARCAVVAVSASAAHWAIFKGTARAGAAAIAPMTYVQLLVATVLGIVLFNDWPDGPTLFGSALIVGAGLWLWRAGARQAAHEAR
ncbi:EamA/RhaT family transporter [Novosphingobium sp. TH158]|nr:EamA/RhaT family transporter [Novosphingobium sp. TH158]